MQVSHESPICILLESLIYNDYDYALVHLFDKFPTYKDFFKRSSRRGRKVILDNSIFELGLSYNSELFIRYANDIKPSHIIVPDSLENKEETLRKLDDFKKISHTLDYNPNIIAVVQGKTFFDILLCYYKLLTDEFVDTIAVSFDYSLYEKMDGISTENNNTINYLKQWSDGRKVLMDTITESYNNHKPVHLLGCSLPSEFSYYNNYRFRFIESLDTSNPVVHGILGIPYNSTNGLYDKRSLKLCDLIDILLDQYQKTLISYNIKQFKRVIV